LIGFADNPSQGLSLQAFNNDVYLGYSVNGNVVGTSRNHAGGVGGFAYTPATMISTIYVDLVYDPMTDVLGATADSPALHVNLSTDQAVSFAGDTTPPGIAVTSDWAAGNGNIYAVGVSDTGITIVPESAPGTSTFVTGLPLITGPQTRTVAADLIGNAFVGSGLDGGGVQLDRLPIGAGVFDAPRSLSATGTSPIVAPLPGDQGAAVMWTEGATVFVSVQKY
jgi:hypothetical protein